MRVELHHLQYFVALAEEKSFGRAATKLGIAQPALSQQIRKLESELGVVLFARGNDGSHLTPAGVAFLPGAAASLAEAAKAIAVARAVAQGEQGFLKIGFVESAGHILIPVALRRYRSQHPKIAVSLIETDGVDLPACFDREELDIAFLRRPVADRTLQTEFVMVEEVVAVLPADHPRAGQPSLTLASLSSESWVAPTNSASIARREGFLTDCRRSGFEPTIAAEASTPDAIIGLVAAGYGVAILATGSHRMNRQDIRTVPLADAESALVMAWREDRRTAPVTDFMRLVRSIAAPERRGTTA